MATTVGTALAAWALWTAGGVELTARSGEEVRQVSAVAVAVAAGLVSVAGVLLLRLLGLWLSQSLRWWTVVACAVGAALRAAASPLTARERDVLAAAEDGSTLGDIAARLCLSESTVRNYLSAAIGKTGTRNKVEAAILARRRGWL